MRGALVMVMILTSACSVVRGSTPAPQPQKAALSQCYPDHDGRRSCRDPIFYVDGKRWENSVHDLNPSEIESVEVFKGELARKQYGDEAKNGVVVITTRKAKVGTR